MPGIKVTITEDTLTPGLARAARAVPAGVQDALEEIGLRIANSAKTSIRNGSPRGRRYRRGKKWHTASAPGQPPALDRGGLVPGIWSETGRGWVEIGDFGTEKGHGLFLEFGTNRMAPRPWLLPAVEKHLPELEGLIARGIKRRS